MPVPRIPKSPIVHNRRQRDGMSARHLEGVRKLPCLGCGAARGVQAHHLLRTGEHGMARTSSDRWAVPLCARCHDPNHPGSLHHNGNEEAWLAERGIDGRGIAAALWRERGDEDGMRRVVERSLLGRRRHEEVG